MGISLKPIAILVDVENISPHMAIYAIRLAKRTCQPVILVSDWAACGDIRGNLWRQLKNRNDITITQVDKADNGENALDMALINSARSLFTAGIRQFFFVSSDGDFSGIISELRAGGAKVTGIGQWCASEDLKNACDRFLYFPLGANHRAARKAKWAKIIPDAQPVDYVRDCWIKAYRAIAKKYRWILLTKLCGSWAKQSKGVEIPADHPAEPRDMIKIYHDSFEWKLAGGKMLIRLKQPPTIMKVQEEDG
ncbi:NYN domain-containing protein [Anaeroselena agilis]|uniref:NYN domain-containing protein n=1 Tax=Anaeroselena agilis TaxID=3063788 RepID=A0ABU3P3I3_9FIRM|nr:NYN domain-containing protein [Selenomonadales bacterium 4137-cl]